MRKGPRPRALDLLAEVMRRPVPPVATCSALVAIAGWDSIMMVRLILRLEELLERELTEPEIESIATIADIERVIG